MPDHTKKPFAGVRVLDFTQVFAGPFGSYQLALLGADVIKIERPGGEDMRRGPINKDWSARNMSTAWMAINSNKRNLALDLTKPKSIEIVRRLAVKADVVMENFRPGIMDRMGIGYEVLSGLNPKLIYCAVSGFGHTGPYAPRPAYDMVVQAMGGVMSLTGHPNAPPTRVGTSMGDLDAGLFAVIGIVSALYARKTTGRGQKIDISMLDCQVALLENAIARYVATGQVPERLGSRHPSIAPFAAFATKDGHIAIAAGNDELFAQVAKVLGREQMIADPRFASNLQRVQHHEALHEQMELALSKKPSKEWLALLDAAGVPSGPLNNVAQVMADPQVLHRNMIVTAQDPELGPVRMQGNPVKMSAYEDPKTRPPASDLDADRAAILRELGL